MKSLDGDHSECGTMYCIQSSLHAEYAQYTSRQTRLLTINAELHFAGYSGAYCRYLFIY